MFFQILLNQMVILKLTIYWRMNHWWVCILLSYCKQGPSWLWLYGSWLYTYLWNQCLSPLTLWFQTALRRGVLDTALCDKVCQWLAIGRWFSLGTPVYSTNKTDHHDIAEILLKVVLNTINQTNQSYIDGVMVSVLTSIVVDYGLSLCRVTKDYIICICCFSAKHAVLRSKSKDWIRITCLSGVTCFSELAV
jgi:hypothetical protein